MTLRQKTTIDVVNWAIDTEFGVFPQGARAKEAVFAPKDPPEDCLLPSKRYLFKRSRRSYPDQLWAEVIAYRVGCAMGVEVPPAFAAWNSKTQICGALIEWFYNDGEETCILAGDFLAKIQPGFDRAHGTEHNLHDITRLLRAFSSEKLLPEGSWRQWWVDALAFDALIGNTDRHQDNWAILFKQKSSNSPPCRLSPLFDNGTSLGHERFPSKVSGWDSRRFDEYIRKGHHHVAWSLQEPRINGHFELLSRALEAWPDTRPALAILVEHLSADSLQSAIEDLPGLKLPVPLSVERYQFICKLLNRRLEHLRKAVL